MCRTAGHNLWPLKLVTKMFELARDGGDLVVRMSNRKTHQTDSKSNAGWTSSLQSSPKKVIPEEAQLQGFELILHTHTPVHAILSTQPAQALKWSVQTSRGTISAKRVIHATNAYASHLLPHLSGPQGIVPVRGQVAAIRAEVGYVDEGWEGTGERQGISRSGFSANKGFEYWFPRPHPKTPDLLPHVEPRKPLIILGGARETLRNRGYGMYETDDSVLDPEVSACLRAFLGHVFPGKFPPGVENSEHGVEVEWVGLTPLGTTFH
jgi:glycine/D-amino acid oxidase-like deaminating enzyme